MHIETVKTKKGTLHRVHVKYLGQKHSRTFRRKVDARDWGEKRQAMLENRGRFDLTFKELAEEWLQNHSQVRNAPATYMTNVSQLQFIYTHLGNKLLYEISYGDIERLVTALIQTGTKCNKSVNRYLTLVRAILNYGIRKGDLLRNPVNKDHFLPEDEIPFQYWTKVEAERFIAFANEKYADHETHIPLIYKIALNTGMRWGEIVALKWDSVVLKGELPYITVRRSYCTRSHQIRETTKGRKIRQIGINSVLLNALQETKKHSTGDLVVPNMIGSVLNMQNFKKRRFYVDVECAGISRIRFHDLRHTFASLYMMGGGSIFDLQKILGHRDIQTTMRYAHLAKDYILNKSSVVVIGQTDNVISVDFERKSASI